MAGPLRIVVASHSAEGFGLIRSVCAEAGHTTAAYVFGRTRRPGQVTPRGARDAVSRILDTIPPGMDLLLPGGADGVTRALREYQPDLVVCHGFPWRIPASALRIPRLGIMNIHPSLLPKYRGPLPVAWAIRNGDSELGVTLHWMDENFDSGRIIVQRGGIPLDDEIAPDRLFGRIRAAIRDLLPVALERAAAGFSGEPQNEADASYAGWMEPAFSRIDWSRGALEIHNQVRAARFLPDADGPVAFLDGAWVKIFRTRTSPGDGLRVECADGPIWVVESALMTPPATA
jgi:methionyl-tRNA formyltransferase